MHCNQHCRMLVPCLCCCAQGLEGAGAGEGAAAGHGCTAGALYACASYIKGDIHIGVTSRVSKGNEGAIIMPLGINSRED